MPILVKSLSKSFVITKIPIQFYSANWGFHKLDEIGNNANIDIRGFST